MPPLHTIEDYRLESDEISLKSWVNNETSLVSADLEGIARYLREFHCCKIVVLSGGRMSVPAGFPDLRSPDVGLYYTPVDSEIFLHHVFNKKYFMTQPKYMLRLLQILHEQEYEPTLSHYFIALLEEKGLLLKNYTFNMDCLEEKAGIRKDLVVQINGNLFEYSCSRCGREVTTEWFLKRLNNNTIPECKWCAALVKPNVTFYGEPLPEVFYDSFSEDLASCELLILLGTSLSNEVVASYLRRESVLCPRLMVSDVEPYDFTDFDFYATDRIRDVLWIGDCDAGCRRLVKLLGWEEELRELSTIDEESSISSF